MWYTSRKWDKSLSSAIACKMTPPLKSWLLFEKMFNFIPDDCIAGNLFLQDFFASTCLLFRLHPSTMYLDVAYCYRLNSTVCRSVTVVSPVKTVELVEMQFGLTTWVGPRNHVLDGSPDTPVERGNYEGAAHCKV